MSNITWTIRVRNNSSQSKYWGDDLDQCFVRLRKLASDLTPDKQIIVKILYHAGEKPPVKVSAGTWLPDSVAVFFDHQCTGTGHHWYADAVDGKKQSTCCRYNVSEAEQFIQFFTS